MTEDKFWKPRLHEEPPGLLPGDKTIDRLELVELGIMLRPIFGSHPPVCQKIHKNNFLTFIVYVYYLFIKFYFGILSTTLFFIYLVLLCFPFWGEGVKVQSSMISNIVLEQDFSKLYGYMDPSFRDLARINLKRGSQNVFY